jgi:hypothetical protein
LKDNRHFYRELKVLETFSEAVEADLHYALPDDWWVVVADVADSTSAIDAGDYKKVNTVGVACIAAVTNVDREINIPYVFGGDGAIFAIPDCMFQKVVVALRGAQRLSQDSFGLDLRVGLVSVGDLAKEKLPVNLAKVRLSRHLSYASLSGSGWEQAEQRVKANQSSAVTMVHINEGVAEASFEGFECRWQGVPSFNGHKLSLLIAAVSDDAGANYKIYQEIFDKIHAIYGDVADYHPLRSRCMQLTLNPKLLSHEWRVRSLYLSLWSKLGYIAKTVFQNLAGKYLFSRNLDTEAVKWSHYRAELVENTDFRKFDGMLRMVIDSSDAQASALEVFLKSKHQSRQLVYGMHKSREALVTCLIQSYTGNHFHFVDGSDGGYAMAARALKQQLAASMK